MCKQTRAYRGLLLGVALCGGQMFQVGGCLNYELAIAADPAGSTSCMLMAAECTANLSVAKIWPAFDADEQFEQPNRSVRLLNGRTVRQIRNWSGDSRAARTVQL